MSSVDLPSSSSSACIITSNPISTSGISSSVNNTTALHHHHHSQLPLNNNNFVIVELHRDDLTCPSFGFNIKGGAESGCPVYIWRVEPGSLADRSGLKSGDEIVQANGISFTGITHAEALKVLKGQTTLTLYIKGNSPTPQQQRPRIMLPPPSNPPLLEPPPPQQQSDPVLHHRVEYYTWVDRHGNPVPPPNPSDYPPERVINLDIAPGQNLGLMIRGGCEYGLGIYVTGVDPGSVAERVGLQRGDEILNVNNKNFTRITHDKAVQILKSSKHMQIVASYIGKIPADLNDEDLLKLDDSDEPVPTIIEHDESLVDRVVVGGEDEQIDGELDLDFVGGSNSLLSKRCTTSILQMIEEKARTVLNKSEHSRFTFYRIEYMQGFLPVVAFVRILLELLNTHEKYTLLTEVRELIRPVDLHQFDELIYNKSTSFRVSTNSTITTTSCTSTNPLIPTSIYQNNNNELISSPPPPPPPPNQMLMQQQNTGALSPQQQQQQQQQQGVPPPQHIMHHHNMQGQDLGVDEIVDDFIENPNVSVGNMNEMVLSSDCNGPFPPPQWRNNALPLQQNTGNVQPPPGVDSRQLLITHDPAALQMSHPAQVNVGNPPANPQAMQATRTTTTSTVVTTTALQTSKELSTIQNSSSTGQSSTVPAVRFKVRINKVKPILGIAIEGGSNTPHRLPRIIDVNPDGSAFHSNLRAGQVLLTVDGKKLDGLTHEEIARLILDCYVDMTKSQIEFLVVEAKQNYYYFNSHQSI